MVQGLVVALAWSLARALPRGVFIIVLALTQNLFNDDNNNNNNDAAFISPCRPCHRWAAVALVRGLVVVLAQLLAQALARGVFVIFLALVQNLFDNKYNNDDDDAAFVSPCRPPHSRQAAAALVWWLVVALARSLAQALTRGVFVIVLALAQNLFEDYDDNDDDDNAFVSSLLPLPPLLSRRRVGSGVGC